MRVLDDRCGVRDTSLCLFLRLPACVCVALSICGGACLWVAFQVTVQYPSASLLVGVCLCVFIDALDAHIYRKCICLRVSSPGQAALNVESEGIRMQ